MGRAVVFLMVLFVSAGLLFVPVEAEAVEVPHEFDDELLRILRQFEKLQGVNELKGFSASYVQGNATYVVKVDYLKYVFSGNGNSVFESQFEIRGLHIEAETSGSAEALGRSAFLLDLEGYSTSGTVVLRKDPSGDVTLSLYVPLYRLLLNA